MIVVKDESKEEAWHSVWHATSGQGTETPNGTTFVLPITLQPQGHVACACVCTRPQEMEWNIGKGTVLLGCWAAELRLRLWSGCGCNCEAAAAAAPAELLWPRLCGLGAAAAAAAAAGANAFRQDYVPHLPRQTRWTTSPTPEPCGGSWTSCCSWTKSFPSTSSTAPSAGALHRQRWRTTVPRPTVRASHVWDEGPGRVGGVADGVQGRSWALEGGACTAHGAYNGVVLGTHTPV